MSICFTISRILSVLKREKNKNGNDYDDEGNNLKEFKIYISCKGNDNLNLSQEELSSLMDYSINKYQNVFLSKHIEFANFSSSSNNYLSELAKNIHLNANHYINDFNLLNVESVNVKVKDENYRINYEDKLVNYKNLSEDKILLFDLDDTLYTDKEILDYQVKVLTDECKAEYPDISEETLRDYYLTHGSTYKGLRLKHDAKDENINKMMFNAYSKIDVGKIKFKPKLKELFKHVNQPSIIVSNAPKFYVERVLKQLQIEDKFIDIISPSHDNNWIFKTCNDYNNLLNIRFGENAELIIFDDNKSNCEILNKRFKTECILITKDNPIEISLEKVLDTPHY
jgi:FMN phosphatase YigB (HAD superfamily)